jgi:secondary thiamine-phosphate synthase enzyme
MKRRSLHFERSNGKNGWAGQGGQQALKVHQQERRSLARGSFNVTDITDGVNAAVRGSGIRSGIACVYSPDTTCCVRVNEFETGLVDDFAAMLRRLSSETSHTGRTECVSMLLGPAGESIPVAEGALLLGRWQRVLFVELNREHDGRWLVQTLGSYR